MNIITKDGEEEVLKLKEVWNEAVDATLQYLIEKGYIGYRYIEDAKQDVQVMKNGTPGKIVP